MHVISNKYKWKRQVEKKVIIKIVQLHCNFLQKESFNLIFHLQSRYHNSQIRFKEKQNLTRIPPPITNSYTCKNIKRKILLKRKIITKIIQLHCNFFQREPNLLSLTTLSQFTNSIQRKTT